MFATETACIMSPAVLFAPDADNTIHLGPRNAIDLSINVQIFFLVRDCVYRYQRKMSKLTLILSIKCPHISRRETIQSQVSGHV